MKLTIIDKYIAKELLTAFLAVIFVLLIIVLSTEVVHLLKWVTEGVIPVSVFLPYLINSIFEFSVILIPLSLLMGILLAFGRLYHDSEMAAIMSVGIGPMQWYRPLMLIAIPITLLLLILLMFVQPVISHQRALIRAEVRSMVEVDTLMVGQFNRANKGDAVLFLESENKKSHQVENIFFQQHRDNTSYVDLATNISSYYDEEGQRYMMMHGGTHYIGNVGEANFKIIKYKDYGVYINKKQVEVRLSEKTKSISELWSSTEPVDQAELQWRITIPLATIIVAFMALPLSQTDPRSGRYAKLALALILYLIYSNLLGVGRTWIIQEKVPVWIGTWWVHLIAIIVTLVLLKTSGYLSGFKIRTGQAKNDLVDRGTPGDY
ncbi:MAG: LPS export ABC transporter permease LptF [Gammaproteobacteria bacterium]|nr:LPS export ABC transporter permease LptF [Gammaproteobacteria bacterium]